MLLIFVTLVPSLGPATPLCKDALKGVSAETNYRSDRGQLTGIFLPMAVKLRGVFQAMSNESIRLAQSRAETQLRNTKFVRVESSASVMDEITIPYLVDPIRHKAMHDEMEIVNSNAANGAKHYRIYPYQRPIEWQPGVKLTLAEIDGLRAQNLVPAYSEFAFVNRALWALPPPGIAKVGGFQWFAQLLITPVGAYQSRFAKEMLLTAQTMVALAMENLREESASAVASNYDLLKTFTARTKESKQPEFGPLSTMIEGIVTLNQYFLFMTAERIPGYSSGAEALHDLIYSDPTKMSLVSQFTARLPVGLLGPATLLGAHLRSPVVRTADGYLRLSDNLIADLKQLRQWDDPSGDRPRVGLCPMAPLGCTENGPQSGLQVLAETYWQVFQAIQAGTGR